jgi:hypothetical protein
MHNFLRNIGFDHPDCKTYTSSNYVRFHKDDLFPITRAESANLSGHESRFYSHNQESDTNLTFITDRTNWFNERVESLQFSESETMCVEVPHTHKFLQNGFSGWNSQGQEYDVIVIPILNTFGRQLQRNLLYTAITRAKKKVLVVGQISALTKAVQNDSAEHRRTLLADRIMCLNGVSADIPAQ